MHRELKYLVTLTILLCGSVWVAAVELGDSRDQVVAELGRPTGLISSGDYELLSYDRGDVELREGEVVKFDLLSDRELVARRRAEQIRAAEEARQAEEARRRRYQRGIKVKRQMLDSPSYAEASGTRKVEILRRFHGRYPEVEIDGLLEPALAAKRAERQAAAEERRIAELERRVEQAEDTARQAELRAEQAERSAQNSALNRRYYIRDYPYYYERYHRPKGYGLSVGYESPRVDIRYKSRYGGNVHTHRIPARKDGAELHEVMPQRLKGSLSTSRFNDGL